MTEKGATRNKGNATVNMDNKRALIYQKSNPEGLELDFHKRQ